MLVLVVQPALSEETATSGPFTDTECITCHQERNPGLIKQWRAGPHGAKSGVWCSSCHGDRHENSSMTARRNLNCASCHQGPAAHSYATSKHGVINSLEEVTQDWSKTSRSGNYRAPGCSYCHLHAGDHDDTMATDRGPEVRQWICVGCHSPRYIHEQFANAKRQLEIADLKVVEGEKLIGSVDDRQIDALSGLRKRLVFHRKNVLYGVGHQSPDYQWWHGQPALDGDLIRIRDVISESHRRNLLSTYPAK